LFGKEREAMAYTTHAKIGNITIKCPICNEIKFKKKKYLLTGTWLQALDMEGFGEDALMLICENCGHVMHFARPDAIEDVGVVID
jgi:hypothetical protein